MRVQAEGNQNSNCCALKYQKRFQRKRFWLDSIHHICQNSPIRKYYRIHRHNDDAISVLHYGLKLCVHHHKRIDTLYISTIAEMETIFLR